MPCFRLLLSATVAVSALTSVAHAQSDPRLSAIEAQIKALQAELSNVRRDLAASRSQARAARQAHTAPATRQAPGGSSGSAMQVSTSPASSVGAASEASLPVETSNVAPPSGTQPAAPNPGGISFPKGRPTFTSNDGRFSAAVGLQINYDLGGEFTGSQPNAQPSRLDSFGQNLRRGRIPFVFKYDDFQVNITPDFGNSPDGSPTLYEANINYVPKGTPLTATIGYFKPWLTLGDSTSSNDFMFLERPSIVEASRSIAAGDGRSAAGVRWAEKRYFIASYLTGAPYASQSTALAQPQQTGGTIRVAGRPIASEDTDLHLGLSGSSAFRIQRTSTGQTLTVQDRPELRIDTNRLVSTGALNASSAYTYGPEVGLRYRNFLVQGEYGRIGVNRANTPNSMAAAMPALEFDGGYVEGSWVITGETRAYDTSEAAFGSPKPKRSLSLKDGQFGAFELVGRYSHLNLNDKVTRGISQSVTGGTFGGEQNVYSAGINWYPNDFLRLMLDYDIVNVDRLSTAGTTQIGRRYQALALRAQAAF
ncbi:MAG: OprO/OprP family phosphate-selective porin [Janthinobacterium lividum]